MSTVAVTGAAGSVGRRVVQLLAADPTVTRVTAIDRVKQAAIGPTVERHLFDLTGEGLAELLNGCDSVVHLAEDQGRRGDASVALLKLDQLLAAASRAGCGHVVVLSSALVYGAHPDNPVPLTEARPRRALSSLAYATTKASMEAAAERWACSTGAELAILRPTTALSERGVSAIAAELRAAAALRPEPVETPVQFLHHDDLASAVALSVTRRLTAIYNVAPDGWISSEEFRALRSEAELRWPEPVDGARVRLARAFRSPDPGLDPYVTHSWVVANDRLRAAGWNPAFTNEEAYVLGTPAPVWRTFTARRRQELALGAAGTAVAALAVGAGVAGRRLFRR